VLGVPPTATWKEVRQAYYRLAMRYHPDRLGPGGTADQAKFQDCARAYRLLREEELRRRLERASSARRAGGFEPANSQRLAEEAPPVAAQVPSRRRSRRVLLRNGIMAAVACTVLALAGCLTYALMGRDTWEGDHRDSLGALASEARRLVADGRDLEAVDRYGEICRVVGNREPFDPDLRRICGEARTVSAHAADLHDLTRREQEAVELESAWGYARASRELGEISRQSQRFTGDPIAESIARRAAEEGERDDELARQAESQALRERQAAAQEERLRAEADTRRETAARDALSAAMAGLSASGATGRVADAVHLLYVAADLGEPRAMYTLGNFYERGDKGDWAPAEAAKWYAKAAAAGDRDAMNALGHLYLDGRGVTEDDRKAVEWLKKAGDAGNARAMYTIGTLFETGRAGAVNMEEAAAWYRKAAASGDMQARDRLAAMAARHGDAGQPAQSRSSD